MTLYYWDKYANAQYQTCDKSPSTETSITISNGQTIYQVLATNGFTPDNNNGALDNVDINSDGRPLMPTESGSNHVNLQYQANYTDRRVFFVSGGFLFTYQYNTRLVTRYIINCRMNDYRGAHLETIIASANAYVNGVKNSDGYWYERGSVANTAPSFTQIPTQATKKDAVININLANYFSDAEGNALTFAVSSSNPSVATATVSGGTLTLTGKEIGSTRITVDANDGQYTTTQSFTLNITNTAPTVSVSSPASNVTLYENDTLTVTGAASDVNANQSVTVYAQINNEQRIVLTVGLSNTSIAFNKQLKFVGGRVYDGDTPITGNLADGVPHVAKIWAQDGDGGQSTIAERTFYVVPNRVPLLTVNTPTINGNIDSDKIQLSGAYSDPDGNACTVSYKINGGNSVQVASGVSGNWSFEITFGQLVIGQNHIVIENIDSYGAKTSKTVKLNKTTLATPLLKSVARYKLTPPLNEATGVLLYVQRSEDLVIDVKISMTLVGEPENFVPMSLENTAPVPNEVGIVEDELYYIASESKQNIIVQIDMERSSVNVNDKIIVIEGAFY